MTQAISWWNCSPKLSNNGLPRQLNCVPEALRVILETGRCDFKFVIQQRQDLEEIERDYLPLIPPERIMLMAEGTTAEAQHRTTKWLIDECARRGYRFSPRLQILAWGNERGR